MKNLFTLIILLLSFIMLQSCHDLKKKADLIIYNATVYTLDSLDTKAECIALLNGKIIAVGSDAEVRSRYGSDNYINARKSFVYPGFIDAHSHFTGFALNLRYADLSGAGSFNDILSIVKDYSIQNPGKWVVGRGWDQNNWPGRRFPDNRELNRLFPDVPVVLTRVDGHAVLANIAAIRQAGITPPYITGEVILQNGIPTGVFLEHAADKLRDAVPLPSADEMTILYRKAADLCHAAGLTGVNDAGVDKKSIQMIDSLQSVGDLKLRIDAMINPTAENLDYFLPGGPYITDYLRVGSVKLYADGALGSRGACLLSPYSDDPSNVGIIVTSPDEIRKVCQNAEKYGFQVNTHAIGDSAVRLVLRIYGEYLKGKNDLRWRIEHAQVVNEEDFYLFGKYSIIPSVQATHATSDMSWAESRLGSKRLKNAYAYHRLMMENGWIANGTDFPVENISPLLTFYAAVARKDIKGNPENGFMPENALSRRDALRSITSWAAKASFQEKKTGSIEKGKMADIVILDADLMTVPEHQIPAVSVNYTIVNGEVVYKK